MNPVRFDEIGRIFAARRLSRRQAPAQGGAGLALTGLAAAHAAAATLGVAAQARPDAGLVFIASGAR